MSSLRSHTVAKAAAALPFIRSCEWSGMCVTKLGSGYPIDLGNPGTTGLPARA
jgi:hypothetical protein